jgi:hypothetical protein
VRALRKAMADDRHLAAAFDQALYGAKLNASEDAEIAAALYTPDR